MPKEQWTQNLLLQQIMSQWLWKNMVSRAPLYSSKAYKQTLKHKRQCWNYKFDWIKKWRQCLPTVFQYGGEEINFDFSLVLPVLKTEMEHERAERAQTFFPPHLKILDHFCHSSEAWKLCASHGLFCRSFPSSLQLMETEKELRSYWGHCVSSGDWNHGEQGAGTIMGPATSVKTALESCIAHWGKRWNDCLGEETSCLCLPEISSFLTLLPLRPSRKRGATAVAKRIS